MNILAIESSCDETSASVVRDGRIVLSNIVASQIETHALYGGVVPEIASRAHTEAIISVVSNALTTAQLKILDINAVAVTNSPGLIGALLVGVNFAKSFAYSANLPIIPIHHLKGHVAANYLFFNGIEQVKLAPPFSSLVVSGGNTLMLDVPSYTDYKVIGGTRDDAVGECFDKVARLLDLPYPGGAKIDKFANDGNPEAFKFPHSRVKDSPYDFSFSGIKTFAVNLIHNFNQKGEFFSRSDFCASFTNAVVQSICEKVELLILEKHVTSNKLVLAGGVAANSHLRAALLTLCTKHNIDLYVPPISLCGDNAAMIASQAFFEYENLYKNNTCNFDKNLLTLNAFAVNAFENVT